MVPGKPSHDELMAAVIALNKFAIPNQQAALPGYEISDPARDQMLSKLSPEERLAQMTPEEKELNSLAPEEFMEIVVYKQSLMRKRKEFNVKPVDPRPPLP